MKHGWPILLLALSLATKVRDKLAGLGFDPMVMTTPNEFDALVQKDIAVNAELVKAIGLKPQ